MSVTRRFKFIMLAMLFAGGLSGAAYWVLRPPWIDALHPASSAIRQTVVASGTVMPPAELRLGSLVASTVASVHAREGELVTAGQLLVQLDDQAARAGVEQAEAALAAAKAGRAELSRLNAPAAEAQLREADTRVAQTERQLQREQSLFRSGVSTRSTLDEAQTAAQVAAAQRQAAMLQFKAASAGGSRTLSNQAAIAQAEAQVSAAKIQLAHHQIKAPADGVLLARLVEPGDAVAQGSALFVLSTTGETRLRIEPDERNLALLHRGQTAFASTEAFPGRKFEASLAYIAPAVDPQRGTIEVRLLVPEPPDYLRAHMTVSVEVVVAEKESALVVPRSCVVDMLDAPSVLVIEGGAVVRKKVRLGIEGDLRIEISEGLSADDAVVRRPNEVALGQRAKARLTKTHLGD